MGDFWSDVQKHNGVGAWMVQEEERKRQEENTRRQEEQWRRQQEEERRRLDECQREARKRQEECEKQRQEQWKNQQSQNCWNNQSSRSGGSCSSYDPPRPWGSLNIFQKLLSIVERIIGLILFLVISMPILLFILGIIVSVAENCFFPQFDGALSSLIEQFFNSYCQFLKVVFKIVYPYICEFFKAAIQYLNMFINYLNSAWGN